VLGSPTTPHEGLRPLLVAHCSFFISPHRLLVTCGVDPRSTVALCSLQVMVMVGIRPVADALGRVNKLEVIPLEELGRPRIDVVVNCSGVFRDLFVNQVRF